MVYEVTVSFSTSLFITELKYFVHTMSDLTVLRSEKNQKKHGYKFVSYRSVQTTNAEGVFGGIAAEKAEHDKFATGVVAPWGPHCPWPKQMGDEGPIVLL